MSKYILGKGLVLKLTNKCIAIVEGCNAAQAAKRIRRKKREKVLRGRPKRTKRRKKINRNQEKIFRFHPVFTGNDAICTDKYYMKIKKW